MATYSTKLSITSEGTYNIELNRWSATINVSTTSTDFFNQDVTVTKGGSSLGTISFDSSGQASIDVHEIGTYTFSISYSGETYTQSVSVTEETTYPVILNRWTATIRIYTAASDFYGETLSITKGGEEVGSATIDSTGYAYYLAHEAGTYTFTLNYSARESYSVEVSATEESTYNETIVRYVSTINVSTSSSEFYGHEVVITKDGDPYDTANLSSAGRLAYDVHESGVYGFTLTYSDTESYSKTASITASGQTSSLTLNRWAATVNVSTSSSDFYNHDVVVYKDNVEFTTIQFNGSGAVAFTAHATGTYKFVVEYSASEVYEQSVQVTTEGATYSATLNRWTATINVSTSSSELTGQTLTVSKDGTAVDTLVLPSTVNTDKAYTVHATGTYKFAITYQGTEYSKEVAVTAQTTYSANVSLKPALVAWSSGTDAEIKAMIDGYYEGKLTLAEIKSVWSVGQSRTISLSAMTNTGVGESHRAQDVEMVILDFDHDTLASAVNGITNALITVQQKNCLRAAGVADDGGSGNSEHGYMNSSNTNVGGWTSSARRTWCNNVYYNALPSGFKAMVKEATHQTTAGNQSATMNSDNDMCFLPSEWEVFGATTSAKAREGTQYEYYKTAANRYKLPKWDSSYVSDAWWERSPDGSYTTYFCRVSSNGSASHDSASTADGLAPACAI